MLYFSQVSWFMNSAQPKKTQNAQTSVGKRMLGHINPMLQFSKCLASKGIRVTFVITTSSSKSIQVHANHSINVEIISDGEEPENSEGIEAHLEPFKLKVLQSLAKLIEKHNTSKYPPKILVYDSILPCMGFEHSSATWT